MFLNNFKKSSAIVSNLSYLKCRTHVENPIWDILNISPMDENEQESGQILINKAESWVALNLAVHLNSKFYMNLINGDKDAFRFAWLATQTSYHMIESRVLPLGELFSLYVYIYI